jgi:hypothetical protein
LGGVPLGIIGLQFGYVFGFLGLMIGLFATGLPIDKYLDGKLRQLVEIEDEKGGHGM